MNITKEMIDAFYEAHDKSLELQPRERHQAVHDGLTAALAAMPAPAVKVNPAGVVAVETPQPSIHKRCCQNRWSIDHSAGRPILMLDGCSVIESEDAEYLLRLIKDDQGKNPTGIDGND